MPDVDVACPRLLEASGGDSTQLQTHIAAVHPVQKCRRRQTYHERNRAFCCCMLLLRFFVYMHNATKNDTQQSEEMRKIIKRDDINKREENDNQCRERDYRTFTSFI